MPQGSTMHMVRSCRRSISWSTAFMALGVTSSTGTCMRFRTAMATEPISVLALAMASLCDASTSRSAPQELRYCCMVSSREPAPRTMTSVRISTAGLALIFSISRPSSSAPYSCWMGSATKVTTCTASLPGLASARAILTATRPTTLSSTNTTVVLPWRGPLGCCGTRMLRITGGLSVSRCFIRCASWSCSWTRPSSWSRSSGMVARSGLVLTSMAAACAPRILLTSATSRCTYTRPSRSRSLGRKSCWLASSCFRVGTWKMYLCSPLAKRLLKEARAVLTASIMRGVPSSTMRISTLPSPLLITILSRLRARDSCSLSMTWVLTTWRLRSWRYSA
mmetsp:Transcript_17138/g.36999  ORF Transcript_17138/g.36999 Transcript_17138/m.36999 type:complete len:336 (-) Transcript_17138:554-1561(-)